MLSTAHKDEKKFEVVEPEVDGGKEGYNLNAVGHGGYTQKSWWK